MDLLEDIFTAMRVDSALYARLEARAPWGIAFDTSDAARFAIVVRGACWLNAPDLPRPVALRGGDCFIAKGETRFTLQDESSTPLQRCSEVFADGRLDSVSIGGDGAPTDIVAGRFIFDSSGGAPLMELLPAVIPIRLEGERSHLLQATLQLIAAENAEQSLGAQLVVKRLADVLFIQAVRAYCLSDADVKIGWLAAFADRHLGTALRALHADIQRPWTVGELANVAGMSRSAFALRFKTIVGDTPLNYLARWRMYRAQSLLQQGDLALIEIATRVGYETDGAFNRAFKRMTGTTPGDYRQHHRAHSAS